MVCIELIVIPMYHMRENVVILGRIMTKVNSVYELNNKKEWKDHRLYCKWSSLFSFIKTKMFWLIYYSFSTLIEVDKPNLKYIIPVLLALLQFDLVCSPTRNESPFYTNQEHGLRSNLASFKQNFIQLRRNRPSLVSNSHSPHS